MSSQLLRQDFIPMVAGYLIVLAALALGLRATLRPGKPVRRGIPGHAQAAPAGAAPAGARPRLLPRPSGVGWPPAWPGPPWAATCCSCWW